ncbi:hypothetical protein VDG1235_3036 [Verrucomicrobiia bacterium DG1235]|nr:hypothetical protein VDG1235_3036 [Verrucomicrobiae bacterium DG1235]
MMKQSEACALRSHMTVKDWSGSGLGKTRFGTDDGRKGIFS